MTDSARAQARASGSTSSTPRIRARVDPSLLHSSGGGSAATSPLTASSSTSTSTPTPTTSTRQRLRSNISTASSASVRSGLSSVSASGAGAGIGADGRYTRPQSPLRGGAISPGVFGGAARARLTPASTPVAGARLGNDEDVTPTRDPQGPVRPRARVTGSKSAAATPRLGTNVSSDRSQLGASGAGSASGAGVAGPSRPVPLSSASSPSLTFTSSTGAAGSATGARAGAGPGSGSGTGTGTGPSGRGSPIPGRARIRATPTTTPTVASSGINLRPHSPNPGPLRTAASAALTDGHAQQIPTDARLRAVMTASPSAPAVSSPLSPHVGSGLTSSSASWSRQDVAGDDAEADEVTSEGGDRDIEEYSAPARADNRQGGGLGEKEEEAVYAVSDRPTRPSLALPLTPSSASDGRAGPDVATAKTPAIAPSTPARLLTHVHPEHLYTSLSAPSSPLISASTSQSAQIPRLTRDGALSARTLSQTPTLDRRPRGRPHPLRAALSGAASSGSGLGPGGGGGANGGGPSTPKSPEVHTIALPPLTPSSSRPCYDGIETPRYPHLERRGGGRGAGEGEGEGGVMLGYGGGEGEGDDGGLGLGIIQGLQGLGDPGAMADDDEPHARPGGETDKIESGNVWEAGQPAGGRGYNDRLSGSTVVGSYDEHKELYAQEERHVTQGDHEANANRYVNGTPNGNRLEIVDLPVSRAESESVDSPAYLGDGQEGEDEEDVLEARINRKVADLEISNASLMAINRSLETTKAKQRAEILRLRRQLRESLHLPASYSGRPLLSPTLTSAAANGNGHINSFGLISNDGDPADPYDIDVIGSDDETELDLEIEARWAGMEELVQAMMTKAQDAVARGKEESRPVGRMVLSMGGGENEHGEGDVSLSQADQNGDGVDLRASVASVRTDREGEQGEG